MRLHFNDIKTHKAGGSLAIALALGLAGCGSAHHLAPTTTQTVAAAHRVSAGHDVRDADHHRSRAHAGRPQSIARTISRRPNATKPPHKVQPSAHRHGTTKSAHAKPTVQQVRPPTHPPAATNKRRSKKPSRTTTTESRSGRTTPTPDGVGTAPPTSLNATGAPTGGGQTGQTGASPTGAAGQGVSADG
jgi:hypothetical protein